MSINQVKVGCAQSCTHLPQAAGEHGQAMSGHAELWKDDIPWMSDLEAGKMLVIRHTGEVEPTLVHVELRKVGYRRHDRHIAKRKQVPHPFQNKISLERLYRVWK